RRPGPPRPAGAEQGEAAAEEGGQEAEPHVSPPPPRASPRSSRGTPRWAARRRSGYRRGRTTGVAAVSSAGGSPEGRSLSTAATSRAVTTRIAAGTALRRRPRGRVTPPDRPSRGGVQVLDRCGGDAADDAVVGDVLGDDGEPHPVSAPRRARRAGRPRRSAPSRRASASS